MSEHKKKGVKATKPSGIVVGDGKRHWKLPARLKIWSLPVAGAIVFLLLAGGAYKLLHHTSTPTSKSASTQTAAVPKTEGLGVQAQAEAMVADGKYDEAQDFLASEIAKTSDTATKVKYISVQTSLAINAQKFDLAKSYAQQAEKLQPSAGTADQLGFLAEQQGDKTSAKKYYQLAVDRQSKLPKTDANQQVLKSYRSQLQGVSQ